MEIPKWAFRTDSRVNAKNELEVVFVLRPLGRLWLVMLAVLELLRTTTITLTIVIGAGGRLAVEHEGEQVPPAGEDPGEGNTAAPA